MILEIGNWKLEIKNWKHLITIYYLLFTVSQSFAQEELKSKKIETIDGKKYYIHTVEKGQTLYAISKEYAVSVNDIIIENPEAIDGISPGETLKIPFAKAPKQKSLSKVDSSKYIFHKVEPKQTLYSISKMYSVSIETLNTINPELKDGLKVGQIIKIPSDKKVVKDEKKKIVQEEKKPVDEISKKPAAEQSKVKVNEIAEDTIKAFKNEYNIAFFLPFHLDENDPAMIDSLSQDESKISSKTKLALEFYEGAMISVDSLKKEGFKTKIFVYDLDDSDSLKLQSLSKNKELLSMDLMIGPIYSNSFIEIANFAHKHKVAIVSPLSQMNKILLSNPYASKASSSTTSQLEQMANFIVEKYRKKNVVVLNSTNIKELPYTTSFTKAYNDQLLKYPSERDSVREVIYNGKDFDGIGKNLSDTAMNIIIVPSNNQVYVTELLSKLNSVIDKHKIILFGMQSWTSFDNLDIEYLNNLSLHLPSNSYIDYDSEQVKVFAKKYRSQYKTDPSNYVYQGFDVTYFYLNALKKFGSRFEKKLPDLNEKGIQIAFNFYQTTVESGYENRFCYILMYQDYKLVDASKE